MDEHRVPYEKMIFVCTNVREGEEACGNADRGESCGPKLVELLREEVKSRGLKKKIRVAKSGCMDVCALGPAAMVFDGKGSYTLLSKVTKEDVPAITEKFIAPVSSTEKPA